MKSRRIVFLFVLAMAAAIRAIADTAPQVLAQGSFLSLSDGRTFRDWKIKRQSAASVFILTSKGVVAVDKRKLPEDLRAKFPYDVSAVRQEADDLAVADAAGKAHAAEIDAKRKAEYDKRVAKAASAFQEQLRQTKAKSQALAELGLKNKDELTREEEYSVLARQDQLADSRDGLRISSLSIKERKAVVMMTNIGASPVRFEWSHIRGWELGGKILTPISSYQSIPNGTPIDPEPFIIPPGEKKLYFVDFGNDSPRAVQRISWIDEKWVSYVGSSRK